ncbi:MAG: hypothetical protein M0Z33_03925 [Actinomycetota bacterium]|nr:hypothetical protein [Actinomycetota bacterium]
MPLSDELADEARRQFTICNACRYCEGYCPVFVALERSPVWSNDRIEHLAHLCHDCRGCYYACMYAPPHAFAVNIPQLFQEVRLLRYEGAPGGIRRSGGAAHPPERPTGTETGRSPVEVAVRSGRRAARRAIGTTALTYLVVGALVTVVAGAVRGLGAVWQVRHGATSPYAIIPDGALVAVSLAIALFAVVAVALRARRAWRATATVALGARRREILRAALADAAALRQLHGGGPGCHAERDVVGRGRKRLHGFVSVGFSLCLASTISAAVEQDVAGVLPPYPLASPPVVLGLVGGVLLAAGCIGLSYTKLRADRAPASSAMLVRDYGLLASLGFIALSGLGTFAARTSAGYGVALLIHLAAVLSLFALAPFSKLTHAVYRTIALVVENAEVAAEQAGTLGPPPAEAEPIRTTLSTS